MLHPSLRLMLAVLVLALCAVRGHGQTTSALLAAECPVIKVSCPDMARGKGSEPLTYTAEVEGAGGVSLSYNWSVSAGKIASGQGTSSVTVEKGEVDFGPLHATVEVGGLPASCPRTFACTVSLISDRTSCPLDEYGGIRFDDEKARLDNLAIELQNDPTAAGQIICYGGRVGRAGEARRRCERAKNYLVTARGIEASRVIIEEGGYRQHLTVTLWAVPRGATPAPPSPTVEPGEVKFIRAGTKRRPRRR